jgi:hypothetical protein
MRALPTPIGTTELILGDYSLFRMTDGTTWLEHKDGEGMQVTGEALTKLELLLQSFWKDNF